MATQPVRKCRCASETHGHKPGECTNLATLPELSLCKPCYDKWLEELEDLGPEPGKGDERQRRPQTSQSIRTVGYWSVGMRHSVAAARLSLVENVEMGQLHP